MSVCLSVCLYGFIYGQLCFYLTYQFNKLGISNAKNYFYSSILVLYWSDFFAVVVKEIFHQPKLVIVSFFDCVCY